MTSPSVSGRPPNNPTQQQWARVLMAECWIEGLAMGVSVTMWSWLNYHILAGKIPYFWQCFVPALVHATSSNVFTVILKMWASRTVGIFKTPHVTGWEKLYYYIVDVVMGTIAIGGAFGISKKIYNDPNAHMGFLLQLAIFVLSFFTYYFLNLWTNMAILGMEYKIEICSFSNKNNQPLLSLVREFLCKLFTWDRLLTNYIHIVMSFTIYPPLAELIMKKWAKNLFYLPGLVEIVLLFWFFLEYEACDALCAFLWKTLFNYPAEEQQREEENINNKRDIEEPYESENGNIGFNQFSNVRRNYAATTDSRIGFIGDEEGKTSDFKYSNGSTHSTTSSIYTSDD